MMQDETRTQAGNSTVNEMEGAMTKPRDSGVVMVNPFFPSPPATDPPPYGPIVGTSQSEPHPPVISAPTNAGATTTVSGGADPYAISVKDFGAIGDGSADDTAAINRALSALLSGTSPCRKLFFPSGTYAISGTLNLSASNCEIYGEGRETSVVRILNGSSVPQMWSVSWKHIAFHDFGCDGNISSFGISVGTAAWDRAGATYWSNPQGGAGYGGGQDCVWVGPTIYKCTANHTSSSSRPPGTPGGATYWVSIYDGLTAAQQANMTFGLLFAVSSSGDIA